MKFLRKIYGKKGGQVLKKRGSSENLKWVGNDRTKTNGIFWGWRGGAGRFSKKEGAVKFYSELEPMALFEVWGAEVLKKEGAVELYSELEYNLTPLTPLTPKFNYWVVDAFILAREQTCPFAG